MIKSSISKKSTKLSKFSQNVVAAILYLILLSAVVVDLLLD